MPNITDSHGSHILISDDIDAEEIDVESMLGVTPSIELPIITLFGIEAKLIKFKLGEPCNIGHDTRRGADITIEVTIQQANILLEEFTKQLDNTGLTLTINGNCYHYSYHSMLEVEYSEQFQNALCRLYVFPK